MPSQNWISLAALGALAACGSLIARGRPAPSPAKATVPATVSVDWAYPGKQPPPRSRS